MFLWINIHAKVMDEIRQNKIRIYMGETEDEEETAGLKVNFELFKLDGIENMKWLNH
jgi:hypothetical protein